MAMTEEEDWRNWPQVLVDGKPMYEEPIHLAIQRVLKVLLLIGLGIVAWLLWRRA